MEPSRLPDLTDMVRRAPPSNSAAVVPRSTPVVSFGDFALARVATLGINPSKSEFVDRSGALLVGSRRRLATLDSLGAADLASLTEAQALQVVYECNAYFSINPYRKWFDPLDNLLREGAGVSYYDGSACHLDLVQWATDPVWGQLKDGKVRSALLNDGLPHLTAQLRGGAISLVLINGREVIDQVNRTGLAKLELQETNLESGCSVYGGRGDGVEFLGWSTNLQSSFGVTLSFRQSLAQWLAERLRTPSTVGSRATQTSHGSIRAIDLDSEGYLPPNSHVDNLNAMANLLQQWLDQSTAATVGMVGNFGGKAWLHVRLPDGRRAVLNADTTRTGVEAYLREVAQRGADRAWSVVANRNGTMNKVVFREDHRPSPGWYCYVSG